MDDLFFIASKVLWMLLNPMQLMIIMLFISIALCWTRWWKLGRRLAMIVFLIMLFIGTFPVANWLIVGLENRFPQLSALPEDAAGIIVLGNAINVDIIKKRGRLTLDHGNQRMLKAVALVQNNPHIPVVFTGFNPKLFPDDFSEADAARWFFQVNGVENQMLYEDRARNTYENAVYAKELVKKSLEEGINGRWVLVTSAIHMPRSVGVFRKLGWEVIPAPVEYGTAGQYVFAPGWFSFGHLHQANAALKQWIGLIAYYITGKTTALLPAP